MNLKQNQIVKYDNGIMSGVGKIVGVSNTGQPIIGKTYIIHDKSGNIPNEEYDFECFVCTECHIKPIQG